MQSRPMRARELKLLFAFSILDLLIKSRPMRARELKHYLGHIGSDIKESRPMRARELKLKIYHGDGLRFLSRPMRARELKHSCKFAIYFFPRVAPHAGA